MSWAGVGSSGWWEWGFGRWTTPAAITAITVMYHPHEGIRPQIRTLKMRSKKISYELKVMYYLRTRLF